MADVDIISDVLSAAMAAYPNSDFVQCLSHQYLVRGWLSKKQLEGLYNKVSGLKTIPAGKLATLQAEILKRPTKYRSTLPPTEPLYTKDERIGNLIASILISYPQHKRVLFLESKYRNNDPLSTTEVAEIEKFYKLLVKQ